MIPLLRAHESVGFGIDGGIFEYKREKENFASTNDN